MSVENDKEEARARIVMQCVLIPAAYESHLSNM
jgi:hypothetical protein